MINLTNHQARLFILLKHGLIGEHIFEGKQGSLDFIHQVGCLQFDPVDVCGKNSELTLQSRVKDFQKQHLFDLLYKDRELFDYPDKQLSIIPIDYWAFFERFREAAKARLEQHPEIKKHIDVVLDYIEKNGAICSNDIKLSGKSSWWSAINWSTGGNMLRSVLEQLYSSGDLVVHHKQGTRRYYDLAERYIPATLLKAPEPIPDDFEHIKWRVLRRIGAVGILWDRPSDALLGIWNLTTDTRKRVFNKLLHEGLISQLSINGLNYKFYFLTKDMVLIEKVLSNPNIKPRCELIAPLDPLIWDRKLIKAMFGFEYQWEIYTPPHKRKYGAYVLPLLYGENFIGRIEAIRDTKSKTLIVKNIWYEEEVKITKKIENAVDACFKKLAHFNDCNTCMG